MHWEKDLLNCVGSYISMCELFYKDFIDNSLIVRFKIILIF